MLRRHRQRLVDRAIDRGLPPDFAPPLRWLADGAPESGAPGVAARIERLRSALADSEGDVPGPSGRRVPLRQLALRASVDRRIGALLALLADATGARAALELGSCVGVGTAYLAAPAVDRVISIEASPERAAIARETAGAVSDRVEVVVGRFDDVLSRVLADLPDGLDLAWVDGHHRRDATLRYFAAIEAKLNDGAVVAFDDIRYSGEMEEAWAALRGAERFSDTIDLGPVGIGVCADRAKTPRFHDLRGIQGRPRWLRR